MTHTCTKVTVRQRAIRNNRISLYLDYCEHMDVRILFVGVLKPRFVWYSGLV